MHHMGSKTHVPSLLPSSYFGRRSRCARLTCMLHDGPDGASLYRRSLWTGSRPCALLRRRRSRPHLNTNWPVVLRFSRSGSPKGRRRATRTLACRLRSPLAKPAPSWNKGGPRPTVVEKYSGHGRGADVNVVVNRQARAGHAFGRLRRMRTRATARCTHLAAICNRPGSGHTSASCNTASAWARRARR